MENVFVVRADSKRYVFSADSADDKLNWIRTIELVIKKVNTRAQMIQNGADNKPVTTPTPQPQESDRYLAEKLKVDKMMELMTLVENSLGALMFHTMTIQTTMGIKKQDQVKTDDTESDFTSDDDSDDSSIKGTVRDIDRSMRNFTISNVKQHSRDDIKDPVQRLTLINDDIDNVIADLKVVEQQVQNTPKSESGQTTDNSRLIEENRELLLQLEALKDKDAENEKKMNELTHHKTLLIKVR
jgi:regulator of replication initiation timing